MNRSRLQQLFTKTLLEWHRNENTREFPWKGIKEPYRIWLSEIILQQTRATQGLPYYQKFISHFPYITDLAAASEDAVLKLWQGLGYYARARNLHHTAKKIVYEMGGKFPESYRELLKLKGIGPYTAAAIASFAFGEAVAVVDGNVVRLLSRFFGIAIPFNISEGKKVFFALAQKLIDPSAPSEYNQAIMDFGAVVCTPVNPDCLRCAFSPKCFAYRHKQVENLPVRAKKNEKKYRHFLFVVARYRNQIFIEKRQGNDIWKNLYQLPMIELSADDENSIERALAQLFQQNNTVIEGELKTYRQQLTHRHLDMSFVNVRCNKVIAHWLSKKYLAVPLTEIAQYAFPKTIALHLQKIGLL
jgi:A/G-specific adenine glycosylase